MREAQVQRGEGQGDGRQLGEFYALVEGQQREKRRCAVESQADEDAGANLAAVATDLGIDPQTLIGALVASWSPAIDTVLATGALTEAEAEQYRAALKEAFTGLST